MTRSVVLVNASNYDDEDLEFEMSGIHFHLKPGDQQQFSWAGSRCALELKTSQGGEDRRKGYQGEWAVEVHRKES